jgi:hypothetical protein
MGKLLLLVLVIVLGVTCGILYNQTLLLKRDVFDLQVKLAKAEHVAAPSVYTTTDPTSQLTAQQWIERSRKHADRAEAALKQKNYHLAYRESKYSALALSRASVRASGQTAGEVAALKQRLNELDKAADKVLNQPSH